MGILELVIVVLIVLWLLGLVAGATFHGLIWLLVVVALVVFIYRQFGSGRV